jgi:hypothetical protein
MLWFAEWPGRGCSHWQMAITCTVICRWLWTDFLPGSFPVSFTAESQCLLIGADTTDANIQTHFIWMPIWFQELNRIPVIKNEITPKSIKVYFFLLIYKLFLDTLNDRRVISHTAQKQSPSLNEWLSLAEIDWAASYLHNIGKWGEPTRQPCSLILIGQNLLQKFETWYWNEWSHFEVQEHQRSTILFDIGCEIEERAGGNISEQIQMFFHISWISR